MLMNSRRFLACLLLLTVCCAGLMLTNWPINKTASASVVQTTPTWKPIGPYGGRINKIVAAPSNPNTIYTAAGAGVFKSINAGATWQLVVNGIPANPFGTGSAGISDVTVSPTNENIVLAATSFGLFKTTDGGANWRSINLSNLPPNPVGNPRAIGTVSFHPTTANLVIAIYSGNQAVIRSQDNGETWATTSGTSSPSAFLAFHPTNANIIYAAGFNSNFYRSTDGGASWSQPFSTPFQISSIATHPTNGNTIYLGTNQALLRSTDGGNNFTTIFQQLNVFVNDLEIHPTTPNIVYAALGAGVHKSQDGGVTFTLVNNGFPSPQGPEQIASRLLLIPQTPDTLYAGGAQLIGIFKTTNGGANWAESSNGLASVGEASFAFAPSNPNVLYASNQRGNYRSTNGGTSWSPMATPGNALLTTFRVSPINSNTAYAIGAFNNTLYKTTDGGVSWQVSAGAPTNLNRSIAISPNAPDTVYLATTTGVWKTVNGGANWNQTALQNGVGFVDANALDANVVYATGAAGVSYRTTNGGTNWTTGGQGLLTTHPVTTLAVHPSNANIAYVGTSARGVYKTVNGGVNWAAVNNGVYDIQIRSLVIVPNQPDTVWGGTLGGGLMRTTDGGANWEVTNEGLPPMIAGLSNLQTNADGSLLRLSATTYGILERSTGGGCTAPVLDVLRPIGTPNVLCEGRTFTYTAPAVLSGAGPFTYQWLKNGTEISGATGTTYTTPVLRSTADGGLFSVRVTNACGSTVSNDSPLGVNTVTASANPASYPAAGGTGTLIISAGNPQLGCGASVSSNAPWVTVGPPASGSNPTLTIAANTGAARTATLTVGFQYTVTITQAAGGGTCTVPTIVTQPADLTRCPDITNTFPLTFGWTASVTAAGTGPFTYEWLSGSTVVRTTTTTATTDSYTQDMSSLSGTRTTQVRITNACGTVLSRVATAHVREYSFSIDKTTLAATGGEIATVTQTPLNPIDLPSCETLYDFQPKNTLTVLPSTIDGQGRRIYTFRFNTDNLGTTPLSVDLFFRNRVIRLTQAAAGSGVTDVIWTNLINTSATGSTIRKTGGIPDGRYDGSGVSQQTIQNNGYLEFTMSGQQTGRAIGFTDTPSNSDPRTIDFAVTSEGNYAEFRENGVYISDTPYVATDVFRITLQNGRATYSKNGVALTTGNAVNTAALKAIAVFDEIGGEFSNAKISGGGGTTCTYSIAPTSANVPATASQTSTLVTAQNGCAWTPISNVPWITILTFPGSGNGSVTMQVAANTGPARTGTVTIAGQTFTVNQAAGSTTCTYSLNTNSASVAAAATTGSFNVNTQAGCGWTAVPNASWLTISGGNTGTGSGTINYAVAANTGAQRTGTITVAGQTFTVTQAAGNTGGTAVVWTNLINTTVTGGVVRKTGGVPDGRYDGSAASQQTFASGDFYLEFPISGPPTNRSIGLADSLPTGGLAGIDFEVRFTPSNVLEFRQRGVYLGDTTFALGDIIRIAVEGTRVNFSLNGMIRATSTIAPPYPLRAVALFDSLNGEFSSARFFTGRPPALTAARQGNAIAISTVPCRNCESNGTVNSGVAQPVRQQVRALPAVKPRSVQPSSDNETKEDEPKDNEPVSLPRARPRVQR